MIALKSGDFELTLDAEIDDIDRIRCISVNTELQVHVQSKAFSGAVQWSMDAVVLAVFSNELLELYSHLCGKARLTRLYDETSFIEFEALKGGHIAVRGCLTDYDGQSLVFGNQFDQTYLRPFAEEMHREYSGYLDEKYTKHRSKRWGKGV